MSDNKSYIPNRLKNASKEHPYVAGAVDIIDDRLSQNQQDVNAGFESAIAGLNDQNYVTVEATDEDTSIESIMTRAGVVPQKDTVYRVGFWDGEQYDESKYSEYAWNEAAEEWKLLDVKEYTIATADDFIEPDAEKRAKVVPVGAAVDVYGAYEDNPEFISAETDRNRVVLEGTDVEGNKVFTGAVKVKGSIIQGDIKTFSDKNPEYLLMRIDQNGSILEAIKIDGTKLIGGNAEILGGVILNGTKMMVIKDNEWLAAWTDSDKKILMGIKASNGDIWVSNVNLTQYIKKVKKLIDEKGVYEVDWNALGSFSIIDSPEYLSLETDSEGNILACRKSDGKKYEFADMKAKNLSAKSLKIEEKTSFLKEVEKDGIKDILVYYPEDKITPLLKSMKWGANTQAGSAWYGLGRQGVEVPEKPYEPLSLIWFTDIHDNVENLQRIVSFYNAYKDDLDGALFTGDAVLYTYRENNTYWSDNGADDFLFVLGNHDATAGGTPYKPISPKKTYNTYLAPFLDNTKIVCGANQNYWYKDFPFAKSAECMGGIRLIALDLYHWNEGEYYGVTSYDDGGVIDTGQQEAWFTGLLADARANGMAVIVTIHAAIKETEGIDSAFDDMLKINVGNNFTIRPEMLQDVQDFIDAGGEFICWTCGHVHQDWFGNISDYPDQTQVVVNTASYSIEYRSVSMVKDTKSMDCFDIFSVDPVMKHIRLCRIGVDYDEFGRHIGSIVYNYKDKQIVSDY